MTWKESGMKFGCSESCPIIWSAGGQDEQLWDVNNSTTMGPPELSMLMGVKRACSSCAQKKIRPNVALIMKIFLIMIINSCSSVKMLLKIFAYCVKLCWIFLNCHAILRMY